MVPLVSAQIMFSPGMWKYRIASRNSAQVRAWSMRRLARYGAAPTSSQAARTA